MGSGGSAGRLEITSGDCMGPFSSESQQALCGSNHCTEVCRCCWCSRFASLARCTACHQCPTTVYGHFRFQQLLPQQGVETESAKARTRQYPADLGTINSRPWG